MSNSHHENHDHTYDPNAKPPYVTLFVLIAMVLIGIGLVVVYFDLV